MTFEEYMEESKRTSICDSLEHATLGICGEIAELCNTNTQEQRKDEIGDVLWYLAMLYRCLDTQPVYSSYPLTSSEQVLQQACTLAGDVKSFVFNKRDKNIKATADLLYSCIADIAYQCKMDLSDILEHNINKLKKRYPNGYSHKEASEQKDKK